MASSYDNLSDSELRKKLLEIGYDLPVSINRDFLIKKLKSVLEDSNKNGSRRKSVGRTSVVEKDLSASSPGDRSINVAPKGRQSPSRARSRMSLNEAGSTASPKPSSYSNRRSIQMNDSRGSVSGNTSRGSNNHNAGVSYSSMTTIGDESDSDFDMTAASPSANLSSFGEEDAMDMSWSKKSNPQLWTRFSSVLPTPLPSTPPSNFATPAGETSGRGPMLSSTPLHNGNWKNNITTSVTPTTSRFSLGRRTGGGSEGSSAFQRLHGINLGTSTTGNQPDGGVHFISSVLVGFAVLFFALLAILYLNLSNGDRLPGLSGTSVDRPSVPSEKALPAQSSFFNFSPPKPLTALTSNYPICGQQDVDPQACIRAEHLKGARGLFTVMKEELTQRAKWSTCTFSGDREVTLAAAKTKLYHLSDQKKQQVDECFQEMLILCVENPNWGLKIMNEDGSAEILSSKDLFTIDHTKATISAANVSPAMMCNVLGHVQVVFKYVMISCIVGLFFGGIYKAVLGYQARKKEDEKELFTYVDQVVECLQARHEYAKENDLDSFIAVNHIRDSLVPAKDRLKKAALWDKVVNYISNHESRVREEIQHISGEEFRVWRWLPSASPVAHRSRVSMRHTPSSSPSSMTPPGTPGGEYISSNCARPPVGTPLPGGSTSKWQGQAFELSDGSPNALPSTPTNCLKIRHMFDLEASVGERQNRIEKSILEKCPGSVIFHIGVERNSAEGCVYVKCATKEDARKAYLALHGWWFDGHLLSVKFLREERYLVRFPEAKNAKTPLTRH